MTMTNVDLIDLIEYDEEADAMYIRLNNTESTSTGTFKGGIIIDFDNEDKVVGIEVLYVSKRVQKHDDK